MEIVPSSTAVSISVTQGLIKEGWLHDRNPIPTLSKSGERVAVPQTCDTPVDFCWAAHLGPVPSQTWWTYIQDHRTELHNCWTLMLVGLLSSYQTTAVQSSVFTLECGWLWIFVHWQSNHIVSGRNCSSQSDLVVERSGLV